MPRVKDFYRLPAWLQLRLRSDWKALHPGGDAADVPPIRDPEYRVYRLGDTGWWSIDAGTGGISFDRDGDSSVAWDDVVSTMKIPWLSATERVALLVAVREEFDPVAEQINQVCGILLQRGTDALAVADMIQTMRSDGCTEDQVLQHLVSALLDGLAHGNWPRKG